jgi:hypothetical protein
MTSKDTFARCPQGSHYDAVDALAYLIRSIDFKLNPYPKNYGFNYNAADVFNNYSNNNKIEKEDVYKKLLNVKPRTKYGIR